MQFCNGSSCVVDTSSDDSDTDSACGSGEASGVGAPPLQLAAFGFWRVQPPILAVPSVHEVPQNGDALQVPES